LPSAFRLDRIISIVSMVTPIAAIATTGFMNRM